MAKAIMALVAGGPNVEIEYPTGGRDMATWDAVYGVEQSALMHRAYTFWESSKKPLPVDANGHTRYDNGKQRGHTHASGNHSQGKDVVVRQGVDLGNLAMVLDIMSVHKGTLPEKYVKHAGTAISGALTILDVPKQIEQLNARIAQLNDNMKFYAESLECKTVDEMVNKLKALAVPVVEEVKTAVA